MAVLKLIPTAQFEKQLENGVVKFGSIDINNRLALNFKQIASDIGDYIGGVFNQTEVAKSLRGIGSVDLPAHFGLTDSLANELVDGMLNIIKNSVVIAFNTRHSDGRGTIMIQAIETDWQKYTELPGAKYVSINSKSNTAITIPVVEWMLIDPTIDIGQANYNIVFQGGSHDKAIARSSRSGRAIMISLKALGGTTGYVLPDIISKGTLGQNFIEFAIGQEGVAQKVAELCINRIK